MILKAFSHIFPFLLLYNLQSFATNGYISSFYIKTKFILFGHENSGYQTFQNCLQESVSQLVGHGVQSSSIRVSLNLFSLSHPHLDCCIHSISCYIKRLMEIRNGIGAQFVMKVDDDMFVQVIFLVLTILNFFLLFISVLSVHISLS